jgi:hypothetical protein
MQSAAVPTATAIIESAAAITFPMAAAAIIESAAAITFPIQPPKAATSAL